MPSLSEDQIKALVLLLGDESETTYQVAKRNLVEAGPKAWPALRQAWEHPDAQVRGRARQLLEQLRIEKLRDRFEAMAVSGRCDLETGALLVAEYEDPLLDRRAVRAQLDALAEACRIGGRASLERRFAAMDQQLFVTEGFVGNQADYYHPDNSLLHRVLETRKGIPISLSVLYLLVGRRLGLPVAGVALPGHFVVEISLPSGPVYVDPYGGGQRLSRQDCIAFLLKNGFGYDEAFLEPASDQRILLRMLTNLLHLYTQREEVARIAHAASFLAALQTL